MSNYKNTNNNNNRSYQQQQQQQQRRSPSSSASAALDRQEQIQQQQRFQREAALRHDPTLWRRESMRETLMKERQNCQLVDINHQRVAIECLLQEAADRDRVLSPHGCCDERQDLWQRLSDYVLTHGEDDYQGTVAKLSSMMLWEEQRRRYHYAYYEDELHARRINQMQTINKLNRQAGSGGNRFFSLLRISL